MSSKRNFLQAISGAAITFNAISAIYGIIFLLTGGRTPLENLFGYIILAAFTLNIVLVYLNDLWGAKDRLSLMGMFYLVAFIVAFLFIWGGGIWATGSYNPQTAKAILFAMVLPFYLLIFVMGIIHARLTLGSFNERFPAGKKRLLTEVEDKKSLLKKLIIVFLTFSLLPGFYFAYIYFDTLHFGLVPGAVSQYSLFWSYIFFTVSVMVLHLLGKSPHYFRYFIGVTGFSFFIIFMLPFVKISGAAADAEAVFKESYGENWEIELSDKYGKLFLNRKYSIPAYFLGIPAKDYDYIRDVVFYAGTEGADEGLVLRYDVFMPKDNGDDLPGKGSTIIRIHGGGWFVGSKGFFNMMQMNKYFAAQGYTVFDIQYGLTDKIDVYKLIDIYDYFTFINGVNLPEPKGWIGWLGAPEDVKGPFGLNDMIRHLGIFTFYLAENADKYGVSTDSVFISGGSAGGHLTAAMTLAMTGGGYEDIFSTELNIKGMIPFYPGFVIKEIFEAIGGDEEWKNVEMLIHEGAPPALIYQGTNDGLAIPGGTASFSEKYCNTGNICSVIYMPLASHISDFHFSGFYNQLFLYYMERFMAMHGS